MANRIGFSRILFGLLLPFSFGEVNVALHKKARLKCSVTRAGLAVDGNTSQNHSDGATCSVTDVGKRPHWVVDLGKEYLIERVVIYNRLDCCSDELHDFEITVRKISNWRNSIYHSQCFYHLGAYNGSRLTVHCGSVMSGKIIKIEIIGPAKASLQLCEVEVMGEPSHKTGYFRKRKNGNGVGLKTELTKYLTTRFQCALLCNLRPSCVAFEDHATSSGFRECSLKLSTEDSKAGVGDFHYV